MVIKTALEDLNLERIVRTGVDTKVLNLGKRNGLIFVLLATSRWFIVFWIGPESANVNLSSRNCSIWVNLEYMSVG